MARVFKFMIYGSAIISALILLCFLLDWFPIANNIDGSHRLFAGIVFILIAMALSTFSIMSTIATVIRTKQWSPGKLRPLLLVTFLSLPLSLAAWLAPDDFSNSRDEFELLSEVVQQKPQGWQERYGFENPRQVGSVEVLSIRHDQSGAIIITDADSSATLFIQGWIKATTDERPSMPGAEIHHLTENWYTFRIK